MVRRSRTELLPEDEPLEALDRVFGVDPRDQTELMRELRFMTNEPARGYQARDERIYALVLAGSLSRRDMGRACGLAESRINAIARERAEAQQERWNDRGRSILNAHSVHRMPAPGQFAGLIRGPQDAGPYVELASGVLWGSHEVRWHPSTGQWLLEIMHTARAGEQLQRLEQRLRSLRSDSVFGGSSRTLEGWPLIELEEATDQHPGYLRLGIPGLTASEYARARDDLRTMLDLTQPRTLADYGRAVLQYLPLPRSTA